MVPQRMPVPGTAVFSESTSSSHSMAVVWELEAFRVQPQQSTAVALMVLVKVVKQNASHCVRSGTWTVMLVFSEAGGA